MYVLCKWSRSQFRSTRNGIEILSEIYTNYMDCCAHISIFKQCFPPFFYLLLWYSLIFVLKHFFINFWITWVLNLKGVLRHHVFFNNFKEDQAPFVSSFLKIAILQKVTQSCLTLSEIPKVLVPWTVIWVSVPLNSQNDSCYKFWWSQAHHVFFNMSTMHYMIIIPG